MSKFSIFVKSGGAHDIFVRNTLLSLSKVFDELSNEKYITPTIQAHIEVRIDGTIVSYKDIEGCSHLKYTKSKELIAITIAIRENTVGDEAKFKKYLFDNIIIAFHQMTDRLTKEKYQVDKANLIADLSARLSKL